MWSRGGSRAWGSGRTRHSLACVYRSGQSWEACPDRGPWGALLAAGRHRAAGSRQQVALEIDADGGRLGRSREEARAGSKHGWVVGEGVRAGQAVGGSEAAIDDDHSKMDLFLSSARASSSDERFDTRGKESLASMLWPARCMIGGHSKRRCGPFCRGCRVSRSTTVYFLPSVVCGPAKTPGSCRERACCESAARGARIHPEGDCAHSSNGVSDGGILQR